ncbi:hypothetical protein V1525DRAFT_411080 [Lipomyces kononenkoae]|uniref:Uncharacterized protein n=1 Tax=Lipomyces kononenkoae TaxID=34357 RepID=A0ACC3STX7_LIPKO
MSLDAHSSTESLPPTRQMRLKVLYTFDNAQRTTCLARASSMYSVHVVHCPPPSPSSSSSSATSSPHNLLGVISLRSCLAAVASASPELVSDPESDYAVYTVDYSERDAPLVGHGLLSWALSAREGLETGGETIGAEMTGGSREGLQQMVCGRVCSNLLAVFAGGVRETLEIKLRLSPVPGVSQMRYMRSMQLYTRLSKVLPSSFDPSVWSNFIASNPQVMQLLTAPAYANAAASSSSADPNSPSAASDNKTDFEAFFGLPPNLPSDILGDSDSAGPKRARPRPSNNTTKKSRQPLDDLASSSLNIANNANTPTIGPARKPRSSSARPRKPRTQSARATPAATSDAITSVIDDDNTDSHSNSLSQQPQNQDHTFQSNGPRHVSGTQSQQTLPSRNSMLPQRQALIRATTAPTPSIFSPPSSLCSTNSPYVESPQLASSPPVSGPHDNLSPLLDGPIPKAWTVDFDKAVTSHHDQNTGNPAPTSPTTATFDELMNATLSLDDADVFLSAADNDATISLANDFVKEFYRFDSETEESSGPEMNANTGEVGISTDADMTDALEAQVIEALVMETHATQPRIQISRTKSGSSSSTTGSSDAFDEDPTQNMSPITSPNGPDKDTLRRARSSTPKIDKSESEPATKPKPRVSAKIKERIHESLMQDLAAGKVPRYCENCGDIKTSTWRKIRAMTVNNKMEDMWLCNPCGLYFASKKLMRPQHLWRDDGLPLSSDALDMDGANETGPGQGNTPITPKLFGPTTPAATAVAAIASAPDGSDAKKRKVEELHKNGGERRQVVVVEDRSE